MRSKGEASGNEKFYVLVLGIVGIAWGCLFGWLVGWFLVFFETRFHSVALASSHCISQIGLKLKAFLLPQLPAYWITDLSYHAHSNSPYPDYAVPHTNPHGVSCIELSHKWVHGKQCLSYVTAPMAASWFGHPKIALQGVTIKGNDLLCSFNYLFFFFITTYYNDSDLVKTKSFKTVSSWDWVCDSVV